MTHEPRVGAAPYYVAKGGVGLLPQGMALELAERGITVPSPPVRSPRR